MLSLCIILFILLAAGVAYFWHREQSWKRRLAELSKAVGLSNDTPISDETRRLHLLKLAANAAELERELYLRRLFESLLNEIRQGVLIVDHDLKVCFANRTMAQLFRRPGIQRHRFLLDELQDHQVVETVRSALTENKRSIRQIRFVPTNMGGHSANKHYLIEAAPLPPEAQRGAWLMVHDVTEQVLTEQIRKDFVANASHELRTPLTLIQGYIETLQGGMIDDAVAARHSLGVMEKHGKRIVRIVEDMLTISRLENEAAVLNIESVNVRGCVQDAIDHLAPMLENRDVLIDLDFPVEGGSLNGDRFYWHQIFTNLLENAIKENQGRGLILRVSGQWRGDVCIIKVSDNGVGIPAHDIPFVFKRFYRGHKHHAQVIKGTGLGLSIVRRSVEAHGGSIELESTPGVETVFTITVPLDLPLSDPHIRMEVTPEESKPASQTRGVLVV